MHPAFLPDDELLKGCTVRTGRAGGPGGQHRNKVETAAQITHEATGVSAQASERRSQVENRKAALWRLRLRLAMDVREAWPETRETSALWRSRVKGQRVACAVDHRDYPAMLAETLDALAASAWEPRDAAALLGVSASQIVGLLRGRPAALAKLNEERERRGLGAMR